jgi:hypothetical protein
MCDCSLTVPETSVSMHFSVIHILSSHFHSNSHAHSTFISLLAAPIERQQIHRLHCQQDQPLSKRHKQNTQTTRIEHKIKMESPNTKTPSSSYKTTNNPAFYKKLQHLSLKLAPLVQIDTGLAHPSFPSTLLSYHVLTVQELDDLAHFYHQRTPGPFTARYPQPMNWGESLPLEEKRRKFGKFVGLRGCESPVRVELLSEKEIWERARREREREEEREMWKRKIGF